MPRRSANQQEKIEKQLADLLSKQLRQSAEGKRLIEEYKKDPGAGSEALNSYLRSKLTSDRDLAERAVSALGSNTNRQRNNAGNESQFQTVITDSEIDQIFNIGNLNDLIVKRFFFQDKGQVAVFVLAPLFFLLTISGVLYYLYGEANKPTPGPNDSFNIVIALIGDTTDGDPIATRDTKRITQRLLSTIENGLKDISSRLKVHVDSKNMPYVSSESEAESLAKEVNAHLVVYGYVTRYGNTSSFTPRFYVSPRSNDVELGGGKQLSEEINFEIDSPSEKQLADEFTQRARIYVYYISGLIYLNLRERQPEIAEAYFQKAVNVVEENSYNFEGMEVLYLELSYAQKLGGHYDNALKNLERIYAINKDNPRLYIGLGNVYYHKFISVDRSLRDSAFLDQAFDSYQNALDKYKLAPSDYFSSHVEEKISIGFGNILSQQYDTEGGYDFLEDAISHYQEVTKRAEKAKDDIGLQRLAAYAYSGLGWAYNEQKEVEKAIDAYRQCSKLESDFETNKICKDNLMKLSNIMDGSATN